MQCFEQKIGSCYDSVTVSGLTASTSYTSRLTDKFGNEYPQTASSDVAGVLTIPLSVLPNTSTMPFSSAVLLEIDGLTFHRCDEEFECIMLSFNGAGNVIAKSDAP